MKSTNTEFQTSENTPNWSDEPWGSWGTGSVQSWRNVILMKKWLRRSPPRDPFGSLFGTFIFLGRTWFSRTSCWGRIRFNIGFNKYNSWSNLEAFGSRNAKTAYEQMCFDYAGASGSRIGPSGKSQQKTEETPDGPVFGNVGFDVEHCSLGQTKCDDCFFLFVFLFVSAFLIIPKWRINDSWSIALFFRWFLELRKCH